MNKQETFTFDKVPQSVAELQSLSEYSLDTPFKTAALAMLVLLRWESDPEGVYQLIDALRGRPAEQLWQIVYQRASYRQDIQGEIFLCRRNSGERLHTHNAAHYHRFRQSLFVSRPQLGNSLPQKRRRRHCPSNKV